MAKFQDRAAETYKQIWLLRGKHWYREKQEFKQTIKTKPKYQKAQNWWIEKIQFIATKYKELEGKYKALFKIKEAADKIIIEQNNKIRSQAQKIVEQNQEINSFIEYEEQKYQTDGPKAPGQ